jgi:hypothetical protein
MVALQNDWPDWWHWELDCSNPHLAKRMIDRLFNETDLREMLQRASHYRQDSEAGRWIVSTTHEHEPWEVIVEPAPAERILLVVTAYRIV